MNVLRTLYYVLKGFVIVVLGIFTFFFMILKSIGEPEPDPELEKFRRYEEQMDKMYEQVHGHPHNKGNRP